MSTPETETRWTVEGFNSRFEEILKDTSDLRYTHAYERAETEHVKLFGKVRFPSYDAFRKMRHKLMFGT